MKRAIALALLLSRVAFADDVPPPVPATVPATATAADPATVPATDPATVPATVPVPAAVPATVPATATVTVPAPATPAAADSDPEPKLSLPTEADRTAWLRPGFRLELGLVYGRLDGIGGAPSGRLLGPLVRIGLRLDHDWSLFTSFEYASASGANGGLSGLRFAGTVDPTWHVTPRLSLAVGFGFGGLIDSSRTRTDPDPLPSTLDTSYTFPNAKTPLPSCSGVGAAGLVRADYAWVLGPRASTGFAFEAVGQWTGCVDPTGVVEPDTGQPIVRRQWWPHAGATLAWEIMWR